MLVTQKALCILIGSLENHRPHSIYSMEEFLSKWFNGKSQIYDLLCLYRENYQILMSNCHEKDKEGSAFVCSSERENKIFYLWQNQEKCSPQRIVFPILLLLLMQKEKLKSLVQC